MKMTKEEKERRYYNKKLILDELKREVCRPRKMNWAEFGITGVGCFIGLYLNSIIDIQAFVKNGFLRFAVESLIVAASIVVTDTVFHNLRRIGKQ